jgi:hypothetical protein
MKTKKNMFKLRPKEWAGVKQEKREARRDLQTVGTAFGKITSWKKDYSIFSDLKWILVSLSRYVQWEEIVGSDRNVINFVKHIFDFRIYSKTTWDR